MEYKKQDKPAFQNNSEHEHRVIFVMTTDGEKWHYLDVKSLSRLSHGFD